MSVVNRVLAAVTPAEKAKDRVHARARARASATPGDWLAQVLDHHVQIEAAFSAVRYTTDGASRVAATRELAALLTAHSVAEENVIYPALAHIDEQAHAERAYAEQSAAKLQLGLLDYLVPMGQEYLDRLESIRAATLHHMYEEEGRWFLLIKEGLPLGDQDLLGMRYGEEFERHVDDTPFIMGGVAPVRTVRSSGAFTLG